jgi:hypothetical protein
MKIVRVSRIEERKRALLAERKALRRRDREIASQLRAFESLEEVQEELEAPTTANRGTTPVARPASAVGMRQPRSADSPVSKVQNRWWDLVTAEPGIAKAAAIPRVAAAANTSEASARESLRRMERAERVRVDEEDRIFPNAGTADVHQSEPTDDASRQSVLEIAGE